MMIRSATIGDLKAIQQLFVETIQYTCCNDYSPAQIDVWTASVQQVEKWEHKINTQYFIVLEIGAEIAGFGSLEGEDYIDLLYVHKNYLRKGVASKIFDALQKKAQEYEDKVLSSDVSKTARAFFERKGFVVKRENIVELKGVQLSNYRMEYHPTIVERRE